METNESRTESVVRADLDNLTAHYDWAKPESPAAERGLALAERSARHALAGRMRLEGEQWGAALAACGAPVGSTCKALAAWAVQS